MTNTSSEKAHEPSWWAPHVYTAWTPHNTWTQREDEIPQFVEKLLKISDRSDESISWLNLFGKFTWEQLDHTEKDDRKFFIDFTSCFVPNGKIDKFVSWAWGDVQLSNSIPYPPLISCEMSDFMKGTGQIDYTHTLLKICSIDNVCMAAFEYQYGNNEAEKLMVPHFDPIIKLGLGWRGHERQWLEPGARSKCAVLDPSTTGNGPTSLLFREDLMRRYLEDNELTLCWLIHGDKVLNTEDKLHILGVYFIGSEGLQGEFRFSDPAKGEDEPTPDASS